MNPAGLTLSVLGIWVLCQVFPGQALQRLNIIGRGSGKAASAGDVAKQAGSDAVKGAFDEAAHLANPFNWFG